MSLLMKQSPAISHLALYDIVNTPGKAQAYELQYTRPLYMERITSRVNINTVIVEYCMAQMVHSTQSVGKISV